MIILGLGSNQGDRINNLRAAFLAINQLDQLTITQISPIYSSQALLENETPLAWNQPYFNLAIQCETTLAPQICLQQLKQIEQQLGRQHPYERWSPRSIDIDILAWHEEYIHDDNLIIPHVGLLDRPFALWPLADLVPFWKHPIPGNNYHKTAAELVEKWGSRFTGLAPLQTKQIQQRIASPILMGILNITPDSFSDGNQFFSAENALHQAEQLVNQGAEIIDIGAESTAPHAKPITAEIEWQRLYPVLSRIMPAKNNFLLPPKISIDTRHPHTARLALDMGVDWINDVSGLENPAMCEIIAANKMDCVMMHQLSLPASSENILSLQLNPITAVYEWASKQIERLEKKGISSNKIIFDPGIGFGKTKEQSMLLLKDIQTFRTLGVRILVGHSRKSFISLLNNYPANQRDIETLAISLFLKQKNIDYLRIHQVDNCARAFKTLDLLD